MVEPTSGPQLLQDFGTGDWLIALGFQLFHFGPLMEQSMRVLALSGAETLEHEKRVKPPKWNSTRAAAAGEDWGRVAEAAAAARQERRAPAARVPDPG
jgi:hypothetical protein